MTGYPKFNRPAFFQAEYKLNARGYSTENPAETLLPDSASWEECMEESLEKLYRCSAVALLPGWESSRGALIEIKYALESGYVCAEVNWWLKQNVLEIGKTEPVLL